MRLLRMLPRQRVTARLPHMCVAAVLALVALSLVACESVAGTGTFTVGPAATGTAAANATATATNVPASPTAGGYNVVVYFSKHPASDNDVTAVFPVKRVSPTIAVATYSIQQLIAGPNGSEESDGYYTELKGALSGTSSCSGNDFQIILNTHVDPKTGTSSAQQGTAVLKFCKSVSLPGDLSGGRIKTQIDKTLTQFHTITKVQILTKDGHCFDDLSGQNNC